MPKSLAGVRVLVTGASGFVGGRLAERLVVECGASVRVLVRRVMGAASLARYPIELAVGDMADPRAIAAAAADCDVIFNCAKGKGGDARLRRAVDVDGPARLVEAARARGSRVVHVSTMAVYDRPRDGSFDETTRDVPPGDPYSDTKLEGERVALAAGARLGVPVVVVQPAVVYGPNSGVYGAEILEELRTHRVPLVNGGGGVCNALYIDDLVTALILAATSDGAPGERFLISGPDYPTWADFYGFFERMLGVHRTIPISEADALELWRASERRPWLLPEMWRAFRSDKGLRRRLLATREGASLRRAADRVPSVLQKIRPPATELEAAVTDLPIAVMRPWVIENLARKARVRTDKACDLLGYSPAFNLEQGMILTEKWARWARLLNDGEERT